MACPFFVPTTKFEDGSWPHPLRLPLGGGWRGRCSAPGHDGAQPDDDELRDSCNLGYASNCPRLPKQRDSDAVRFSVTRESGPRIALCFVFEAGHRPAGHGTLEYDVRSQRWTSSHSNEAIQKQADCYMQSYLQHKIQLAGAGNTPSANP